jgi:hypothetical protein
VRSKRHRTVVVLLSLFLVGLLAYYGYDWFTSPSTDPAKVTEEIGDLVLTHQIIDTNVESTHRGEVGRVWGKIVDVLIVPETPLNKHSQIVYSIVLLSGERCGPMSAGDFLKIKKAPANVLPHTPLPPHPYPRLVLRHTLILG